MEAENKAISKDLEWSDNATLTISIEGPYFPLAKFRKALDSFIDLLTEVDVSTSERGEATVEWSVDLVKSGSINITALARPVSDEVSGSRAASIIEVIARVCSWLRLTAGGMLYTCKSNGSAQLS